MIQYLLNLIDKVRRRPWPPYSPDDPFVGVRQPIGRGPGGRSSSVAVSEPDPPVRVRSVATPHER